MAGVVTEGLEVTPGKDSLIDGERCESEMEGVICWSWLGLGMCVLFNLQSVDLVEWAGTYPLHRPGASLTPRYEAAPRRLPLGRHKQPSWGPGASEEHPIKHVLRWEMSQASHSPDATLTVMEIMLRGLGALP